MPFFNKRIYDEQEAKKLWLFLEKIDRGYVPTNREQKSLGEIVSLGIHDPHITSVPRSIVLLTALQSLDLGSTEIQDFSPLAGLTALQSLDLSGTNIQDCSPLAGLTALQSLDLFGTKIQDCSPLAGLTALQSLNLFGTKIQDCSPLAGLSALQSLDLRDTKIQDLSPLAGLTALQWLYLGGTKIQDCSPLKNLRSLEGLDLSGLSLHSIPPFLYELGIPFVDDGYFDCGINLRNVRLRTQPIALFSQAWELIGDYYRSDKVPIHEAKVIFLGDGGAGKTHTIRRILNQCEHKDYDTETTPGVEISPYEGSCDGRRFQINFWDFGGQETMHAMHRCFLTERSLYVVLLSNRYDVMSQARFWLKNVQSFAPHSPVLLGVNRWDNITNGDLDMVSLRRDYPMLLPEAVYYYAKDPSAEEFRRLLNRIEKEAGKLDSTAMDFPESWDKIRRELLKRGEKDHYISLAEYYRLCKENGVRNPRIQNWLLDWYNDMGICFSYHGTAGKNETLESYKVLQPQWLTNAVYALIQDGKGYARKGRILVSNICKILEAPQKAVLPNVSYGKEEVNYILEVMRKFHLSYCIDETEEFIPALCKEGTPEDLHPTEFRERFSYQMVYPYLPDTVIHRLMVRCYRWLNPDLIWRKGLRLEERFMDLTAVLDMGRDDATLRMDLYVNGDTPPWKLLLKLRNTLLEINKDLGLSATDYILYSAKGGEEIAISVQDLLIAKDNHLPAYPVISRQSGSMELVPIDALLGKAFGEELVQKVEKYAERKQESSANVFNIAVHKYYGDVYNEDAHATEQLLGLLDKLVEHNCQNNDKLVEALITALENSKDPELTTVTAQMKQDKAEKKNVFKTFANWMKSLSDMGDGAKTVIKAAKYAPIIIESLKPWVQKIPELLEKVQQFLS